jgi:hypothetical protein
MLKLNETIPFLDPSLQGHLRIIFDSQDEGYPYIIKKKLMV